MHQGTVEQTELKYGIMKRDDDAAKRKQNKDDMHNRARIASVRIIVNTLNCS